LTIAAVILPASPAPAADELAAADEQLLRTLNLPVDGAGLVDFFKKRTLRDGDRPRIQALIRKLGDDDFDTREKALQDLVALGAVAKPLLKEALKDPDVEVVRRVETLIALADKTNTVEALGAAVRQLGRKPVAGAAEALLDFLPFVEDENTLDEFGPALARVAVKDQKPEPALATALSDKNAVRRAVAAEALGRAAGTDEERRHGARALLKDADAQVRRRAAFGLLASKDRQAVPVLIALLADLPAKQTWRLEETLFDMAGDKPPSLTAPRTDDLDSRKKYRDAWAAWWKENEARIDLAKLGAPKPYLGYTLVTFWDNGKARSGKVYEVDATGKVRWELDNVFWPMDAQVLPNGNVLVVEQSGRVVTERTPKNEVVWQRPVTGNAVAVRRLANGNTFIASRNQLTEIDKDNKDVWTINRNTFDIAAAARLPAGGAAILTTAGHFTILDDTGKELKSFNVGNVYNGSRFDLLPGGHVLIPSWTQNKVVEYDADGRVVWQTNATQPTSVQRLPNGNTLISSRINSSIVEVNRTGEVIWTHQVANARMAQAARR
jgi:HEAT repeat protein